MAQPITIKKKPLTIKTIKAMPPPSAAEETREIDDSAEGSVDAPISTASVAATPVEAVPAKGIPFLVSTICALISVICFIVVLILQMNANKDFSRLCYDQPGSGLPSALPANADVKPAAEAPAPAAPAPAEEKSVAAPAAAPEASAAAPAAPAPAAADAPAVATPAAAAPVAAPAAVAPAPEAPVAAPVAPAAPENK